MRRAKKARSRATARAWVARKRRRAALLAVAAALLLLLLSRGTP